MNKSYYPKGLYNFCCNCYMNSLLQCLYYCIDFRNGILSMETPNPDSFVNSLKVLFKELKNSSERCVYPKIIKEKLNSNPLFKNGIGADANDLLDFFFNSIYLELKPDNSNNETVDYEARIYDKNAMLKEAREDIGTKIILDDIFLGMYEKEFKCKNGHIKYSFQTEYKIIFSLESISRFFNKDKFNIYDCFDYNFSFEEQMSEKCFSNNCKHKMSLFEKVYEIPKILIIILDRGYHKKFDKNVDFFLEIDLAKYIDKDKKNSYSNNSNKYTLIGVSTHKGHTGKSGHYISFCLCDDNNYYLFNDACSEKINNAYIIETLKQGSPYILFYRRKEKETIKKIEISSKTTNEVLIDEINKILRTFIQKHNSNQYCWESGPKTVNLTFTKESANFNFVEKSQSVGCFNIKTYNNNYSFSILMNNIDASSFIKIFKQKFNYFFHN